MGIFSKVKKPKNKKSDPTTQSGAAKMVLANTVFDTISDGLIIVDSKNIIEMINPAAAAMVGYVSPDMAIGVNVAGVMNFENGEGVRIEDSVNEVMNALNRNEQFTTRDYVLVNVQNQRKAVAVTVTPTKNSDGEKIISFRDIAKELEEEGEQTEFISTASHEMRTPVASIEGYLGLALNPQCATIDDRARKYLTEAHESSKHLGQLFKDLLDVTKLDDNKARVHMVPVEMVDLTRRIVEGLVPSMSEKKLKYTFGSSSSQSTRTVAQAVYASVDVDFLREIINNLIENAIKYTKEGGAVWVNVRGDGDNVLINVTDTGIGISPDDLNHIFQKFYRVDNSQTREIGGTGLGLYIVKKRAEAMGGKVWAESSFGEGSTFYLSLPRLTFEEYERRKQIQANTEAMTQKPIQAPAVAATNLQPGAPLTTQPSQSAQPSAQPTQVSTSSTAAQSTSPQPTASVQPQTTQPQPVSQPSASQPQQSPQLAQATLAQASQSTQPTPPQPYQPAPQSFQQPVQPFQPTNPVPLQKPGAKLFGNKKPEPAQPTHVPYVPGSGVFIPPEDR